MLTRLTAEQLAGEGFVCASIHPGWTRTRMGTNMADLSPEESINAALIHLDKLIAKDNGLFFNYDGSIIPW